MKKFKIVKHLGYPPFREMIHMVVRHQNMEKTLESIAKSYCR